jgi:hypothetical protein
MENYEWKKVVETYVNYFAKQVEMEGEGDLNDRY